MVRIPNLSLQRMLRTAELAVMPQGNMMRNYKLLKKALLVVAATGLIGLILCAVCVLSASPHEMRGVALV